MKTKTNTQVNGYKTRFNKNKNHMVMVYINLLKINYNIVVISRMVNFMEQEHYIKYSPNPNPNHKLFIKENGYKEINMDLENIIIIIIQIHIIKEIGIIISNKEKEYITLIKVFIKDIG